MLKKFTVAILGTLLSASLVFGSGFSIYEQGAKATAMGGAFIAQANDVTAMFYNPAGIINLKGTHLGTGVTIIMPQASFTGPAKDDPNLYTAAENQVFPPAHFYATQQINENLSFGFSFYTMFGLGSKWPGDWAGRVLATTSDVQTFALNPVMAVRLADNLSIAVGMTYMIGNVVLEKSIYTGYETDTYVESKLDAKGDGVGVNLGLQYKPVERMSIGIVYRDNIMLDFEDGDATFTIPQLQNQAIYQTLVGYFPNTKGSSKLELPDLFGMGISFDFTDQLTVEADYMSLGWSSYDQLTVKFDDPVAGNTETVSDRNYEDSYSIRLGMEYRYTDQLAFRLGYLHDNHAVPDESLEPSLPEGDRDLYSAGIGYKMGNITFDGFYMLLTQKDRKITTSALEVNGQPFPFNGTYKAIGHLFGLTLGYSF